MSDEEQTDVKSTGSGDGKYYPLYLGISTVQVVAVIHGTSTVTTSIMPE